MRAALRRQFDFSLAGAFVTAILVAIVVALAAVAITAPVMGCAAKPPTSATRNAIERAQGAIDRGAVHVDGALERNANIQRGLEKLRRLEPEPAK